MAIDIEKFADDLTSLDVKQLQELKKVLKEKYGLEETVAVSVVAPIVEKVEKVVEKSHVDITLVKVSEVSAEKLNAVKAINKLTNAGLKGSMDLTKILPSTLAKGIVRADAETFKAELAILNCEIELV
jgi:ribosomal protein L7/L12